MCCNDCGAFLKKGEETDAIGHQWKKTQRINPSYTAVGQIIYTCSRCSEKKTEAIKKLAYSKAGAKYTVAGCQYKVITEGAEVCLKCNR